jgi:hypothetical protein
MNAEAATRPPPPDGFEFLGAKPAPGGRWYRYLCPSCCAATVALVPDGTGWRMASEMGCSRGCPQPLVELWQLIRLGEPVPPPPPDERGRRYALAAVRRIVRELPAKPSLPELKRAAFACGGWVEAGWLDSDPVARALAAAARRAGCGSSTTLAAAMAAGRARPGRLPA